jgi:hypothetical protein
VRSERAAQSARQFLHASPRGKLRRRASTQLALRRGGLETAVDGKLAGAKGGERRQQRDERNADLCHDYLDLLRDA